MVITFCLIGKAQRFANCKVCASFPLLFYTVCFKNVPLSCQKAADSCGAVIRGGEDSHPRKRDSFLGTEAAGCAERPDFRTETHKNKGGPDALSHMFNELSLFGK